jgi:alpha-1,2-mannosyltransferase
LLNPVWTTVNLGQVNIIIVLLVVADLTSDIGWHGHRLPRGVLIGLAAAIKLTPLIFIPFLFLTRQFRAAWIASGTFVALTLLTLALDPHSSRLYWTKEVFDSRRAGNLLYVSDQNLRSAIERMSQSNPPEALLVPLTLVFAIGGLALAAWAWRTTSPVLAIVICAATGLIISPVSWSHHYVWVVPLLIWLTFGTDRPRGGRWWAMGVAALFWAAPIWWVSNRQQGYGGPFILLADNAFFLAAVAFLGLAAAFVWLRRVPAGLGQASTSDANLLGADVLVMVESSVDRPIGG